MRGSRMDLGSAEIGPILDLKHGEIKGNQGKFPVATHVEVLQLMSRTRSCPACFKEGAGSFRLQRRRTIPVDRMQT